MARWLGVGAETFSIGFGREIAGWTDKRKYALEGRLASVWRVCEVRGRRGRCERCRGRTSALSGEDKARSFHLRPVWQRFLIVLAGPVANFILAIAIVSGFVAANGVASTPNVVIATVPGSAAEAAGLKPGDRIVAIAGRSTESFEEIAQLTSLYPDQDVRIDLIRGGRPSTIDVHLEGGGRTGPLRPAVSSSAAWGYPGHHPDTSAFRLCRSCPRRLKAPHS